MTNGMPALAAARLRRRVHDPLLQSQINCGFSGTPHHDGTRVLATANTSRCLSVITCPHPVSVRCSFRREFRRDQD